jgi:3-hydroxyacyl-[acyl-carrier-protein] dehydratase
MNDGSASAGQTISVVDINRIVQMIPHRYPMLLVDKVIDLKPDHSAIGIKNVTINEPFFQGHFPSRPVMPGVMIIESMAQTAAILVVHTLGPESEGKLVYFMSVDNARFRRPVVPGDQMHIHVTRNRKRGNVWKFAGEVRVDGKPAADAVFSAMILDEK